jgi:hypothetical protein
MLCPFFHHAFEAVAGFRAYTAKRDWPALYEARAFKRPVRPNQAAGANRWPSFRFAFLWLLGLGFHLIARFRQRQLTRDVRRTRAS